MSMLVLTLITGVGLGALYFLVASGLSLIYGLMHVLNFAHGAFLTLSAFIGWAVAQALGTASWGSFLLSILVGALVGAAFATLTELVLIRPLYERHIEQVLVTVGLSFAAVALFEGIWGTDPINIAGPPWLKQTTEVLGARIPNTYWVLMIAAVLVLAALVLFLQKTRYGMVIRAGVENRSMVTALGIDVRKSFTLVFAIGGAAAGIGGVLAMHYTTFVSAHLGSTLLDLRVHRHRDRRARLAHRRGDRLGARRRPAAVRQLVPGRHGRLHRRDPARSSCCSCGPSGILGRKA